MICPVCKFKRNKAVKMKAPETRNAEWYQIRKRKCPECGYEVSTVESIEDQARNIAKKYGQKSP